MKRSEDETELMGQRRHRSLESSRSHQVRYCIQEDIPVVRPAVGSISLVVSTF